MPQDISASTGEGIMPAHGKARLLPHVFDSYAVQVLLWTDRLYFELGAKRSSHSGLDLIYMDGHQESPGGAVVWGVDRQCEDDHFRTQLLHAELEFQALGGQVMRVYMEDPVPLPLARTLSRLGYRSRVELALMAELPLPISGDGPDPHYTLRAVTADEQWRLKQSLHAGASGQPDGYDLSAADWVELERQKCETGGMQCYLVFSGDEPIATVGLIRDRGVARLKNLYVASSHRKRGVGLATIRLLADEAGNLGYRRFGCFAVEGGNALRVYERAGLRIVSSVTEFSKDLATAAMPDELRNPEYAAR